MNIRPNSNIITYLIMEIHIYNRRSCKSQIYYASTNKNVKQVGSF